MALQVWLPLNGNLNNQGLTNVTVTNSGTTVDNNGKIGKCYAFNGSSKITNTLPTSIDSNIGTLACWFKMTSLPSSSGFYNLMQLGNLGGYATCRFGVYMEYSNRINISIDGSDLNTNAYTHSLTTNQWYHLCVTHDGTTVKLYIDGVEVLSKASTKGSYKTTASYLYVGGTSSYYLKGGMNDVRYYSTVLSPKEIEILSRGLVAHYPLNGGGRGGDNIMPNSAAMQLGSSSAANGVWRDAGSSTMTKSRVQIYDKVYGFQNVGVQTANDGSCYGIDSFPMEANTDYVISMDARITAGTEGYAGFALYDYTPLDGSYSKVDKNYYVTPLTTSWTRCWLHFKTGSNTARNVYIGVTTGSTSVTTQMCKVKIEKGSIPTPWIPKSTDTEYTAMGYDSTTEYDVSGYNYHGTRVNTFNWDSNTARYSVSTKFNGSDNAIQIPFNQMLGLTAAGKADYTINVWTYKTSIGTKGYQTILGGTSGFELEARNASGTDPQYVAWSWGKPIGTYEFNKWCMFTFVHTSSDCKIYVNGEYASTGSSANVPIGNFYIGSWNTYNSQNYEGQMSDFRIYATALSATQVAELYNTAVSVANNGTLMGYELVEV